MANNFKNAFATNVSMSSGTPTDVYQSATGGSGVNSILIELDIYYNFYLSYKDLINMHGLKLKFLQKYLLQKKYLDHK